jgi:Terminase RNaseH-like domain
MTTTPYYMNWLYQEVWKRWKEGDPEFEVVQFESKDNPFFPKEEFERLRQMLPELEFERRYKGLFRKLSGLVYSDFGDDCVESGYDILPSDEVFLGIDFGFNNPTAVVFLAKDKEGVIHVFDEIYEKGLVLKVLADKIQSHWAYSKVLAVYCDPSAAQEIAELSSYGINGCIGANNDVEVGINRMALFIKNKQFKVSKKCRNFLDEISVYQYREQKEGRMVRDIPKKENDHLMDACRYVVIERGGPMSGKFTEPPIERPKEDEFDRIFQIGRFAPHDTQFDPFTGY